MGALPLYQGQLSRTHMTTSGSEDRPKMDTPAPWRAASRRLYAAGRSRRCQVLAGRRCGGRSPTPATSMPRALERSHHRQGGRGQRPYPATPAARSLLARCGTLPAHP
eukprot:2275583-Pyramimonas_sp.AAC.1